MPAQQGNGNERHFDLEAATLTADPPISASRHEQHDAKSSSSVASSDASSRSEGLRLIGDQFPNVAPAKVRPASGRRPGTSSLEEKRLDEAALAAGGGSNSNDNNPTVALHRGKLVEHASRVYRDEKGVSSGGVDGGAEMVLTSESRMMDTTRNLLETELKLHETEQKLRIVQDENVANVLRMEEMMIDLAVSNKESESLKEQFFKMKEYLQQVNEEMGLLRGEQSSIKEITSIGECERLEKIIKGTLLKLENHKSDLISKQLSKTQDEQKMCVVCQDEEKSVLLLPCRHVCVCKGCARNSQLDNCPLCREEIVDRINVFM